MKNKLNGIKKQETINMGQINDSYERKRKKKGRENRERERERERERDREREREKRWKREDKRQRKINR